MTLASGSSSYSSTYTYDARGRLTGLVNSYSEKTTWAYQTNDWLSGQVQNATATTPIDTTYTYGPRGWLKTLTSSQGLQGNGLTPAIIAAFGGTGATPQMGYDALGNRTGFTASGFPTGTGTFNGLTSFAYDARDELTGESSARDGSYSASMIYDGVTMNTTTGPGNPTYERNLSLVYDTKGDNQIASDRNGYSWAYDGDGDPITYLSYANTFDPESRMTGYGVPAGGGHARLAMGYDGDGMRAWKEPTNLARVYFIYDGSDVVAELNSTGALSTYQTVGADGLISRRSGSASTFYTFDPSGNLAVVLNSSSAVLGDELFEANGRRDGSYSARPVDFGGQWGYYGDAETGLTLLGHRYYDAYAGRFLTRDPISYRGGVNLYSYTRNNYERRHDSTGLEPRTGETGGQIINWSSHSIPVIFDTYDNGHRYEYKLFIPPGYETIPDNVDIDFVPGLFGTWRHIPGYHDGLFTCTAQDAAWGYTITGLGVPTLPDSSGWPSGYGSDPKATMDFATAMRRGFIKRAPDQNFNPFAEPTPYRGQ